jgi:hypothetical protein
MKKILFFLSVFTVFGLFAGTLILKDGTRLTDVTIISISKGRVIIEKDKVKKTISVGKIEEYYHADIKNFNDSGDIGEFAEYDISFDVRMPATGVDKDGKTAYCEISYNLTRKGENKSAKKVKAPYFYIYLWTTGSGEYAKRSIYRFAHPKEAKPKGKSYDKAAVLEKVNSFKRSSINYDYNYVTSRKDVKKNFSRQPGARVIKVALKGVKSHKILAYHIEAWGHNTMVAEKDWRDFGIKAKRWWEHY